MEAIIERDIKDAVKCLKSTFTNPELVRELTIQLSATELQDFNKAIWQAIHLKRLANDGIIELSSLSDFASLPF